MSSSNELKAENNTRIVKRIASDLKFDFCGVSTASFLEEEAPRLEKWLNNGFQGKMSYLENHFDKRLDPTKLVEGAKSVISLVYNYYPKEDHTENGSYKIAKYAYGEDYHHVIKAKLKQFLLTINEQIGEVGGRVFVDSAPVHERAWAAKSGLGWVGKNSLLLNRKMGSFFFLAELILDLPLMADSPTGDFCGTCTKCMDACPTDAIPTPYVVDGSRCISYLTIELKDQIPREFEGKFNDWIFGCDVCQDVCPWNRFSKSHAEPNFEPKEKMSEFSKKDWEEITEELWREVFRKSPVKRSKYTGFVRNVRFASGK